MKQGTLPIFGDSVLEGGALPTGIEQVIRSLSSGAPLDVALKSGGFTLEDYESWKASEDQQELCRAIDKAEADFCVRCIRQVAIAADMGDVKSAQWLLERRFSSHFGRASRGVVKTEESAVVVAESIGGELMQEMSEDEYRLLAVEILKRKIAESGDSNDS